MIETFNEEEWTVSAEEIRQYFYCKRIPYLRKIRRIYPRTPYLARKGTKYHDEVVKKPHKVMKLLEKAFEKENENEAEITLFDNRLRQEQLIFPDSSIKEGSRFRILFYHDYMIEARELNLLGKLDMFEVILERNSMDNRQEIRSRSNPRNEPTREQENWKIREIHPIEIKTTDLSINTDRPHHLSQLTAQALLLESKFNTIVSHARIVYVDELIAKKPKTELIEITIDMKRVIFEAIEQMHEQFINELIPDPTEDREKCNGCEYWHYCKNA